MEHSDGYTAAGNDDWQEIHFEELGGGIARRPDSRQVRQLALVLDARSVPCQLQVREDRWCLLVPPESYETALHELRCFHEKNRSWPPAMPPVHPLAENALATLSVLILLATFHNITRMELAYTPDWVELGSAQAERIMNGQWWRLVTALTLHADWGHLSANLAIGGVFAVLLCRELGSGLAWSLLLSAGVLGNLVNAFLQGSPHNSLGASTAVFGAVGILATLSLVRYRHQLQRRWPLPVAAALALLAMLGTEGKNTDLGAHLFGFVYGCCLGVITEHLIGRFGAPGRFVNLLLALLAAVIVAGSWWLALLAG